MGRPVVQTTPAQGAGVAVCAAQGADFPVCAAQGAGSAASGRELESLLQRVEQHLGELQSALGVHDMACIEQHAGELQRALAQAVEHVRRAAGARTAPLAWRRRVAVAGARVSAQREALARASAALDRAIDALMPSSSGAAVYSATGSHGPRRSPTALQA